MRYDPLPDYDIEELSHGGFAVWKHKRRDSFFVTRNAAEVWAEDQKRMHKKPKRKTKKRRRKAKG